MDIVLQPVAFVRNTRRELSDDFWGGTISEIVLAEGVPEEALDGIEGFSHLEIIFYFDQAGEEKISYARRPRGNPAWPPMGILAQRNKDRPNRLGLTTVELIGHAARTITVRYLDAIDGTPILDIKPVFREFQPKTAIRQPQWVSELLTNYWK